MPRYLNRVTKQIGMSLAGCVGFADVLLKATPRLPAAVTKGMTNRERMRSMGNKELAREILALLDGDFMTRCCRNLPECQEAVDRDEDIPDEKCIGCIAVWLEAESNV